MGDSFAHLASSGPLLGAVAVAALAGLVSFLSPCVLPLVPGYLSYVTGMAGADLDAALGTDPHGRPVDRGAAPSGSAVASGPAAAPSGSALASGRALASGPAVPSGATARVGVRTGPRARVRGRILLGSALFVAGFTVVFTLTGVVVAQAGRALLVHQRVVEIVVGALVIVLGLAFAGLVPGLQRDVRIHRLPDAGLAGAPVLGAVFALSWTPCVGPTLGAVLGLAAVGGQTGRAVTLTVAYCLGLGLPFLAFGLGFRRLLGLFAWVRRHSVWVTRIGGALLVLIGLALVTGGWTEFVNWLRATVGAGTVGV